jgi:adenosylcobinamide-GDP ribazoletransferase
VTALLLAFQFLTRYPVGPALVGAVDERELGRSTRYFPLVGLVAGLDLMLARWLLGWAGALQHWPLASAAVLTAYWAWICDSLHLDGWMDTLDGLASRRQGPALLDVMHDSRVGAFGALGGGLVLLLKFAFLASLPPRLWWALPLPLLVSRLLAALLCHARPYAGKVGSLSGAFITCNEPADGHWAVAWAFLGAGAYGGVAVGIGWADLRSCLLALGMGLVALTAGLLAVQAPRRRLGGISGDLIGYGLEAAELTACYALLFAGL